jgi:hypothetical protein
MDNEVNRPQKQFKIFIRENIHVPLVALNVLPNDTIKILKKKIRKLLSKDETISLSLSHRKQIFVDEEACIMNFKIRENSILDLKFNRVTGGMVFIKRNDTNKTFSIDYKRDDKIIAVKEKISELFEIPIQALYLSAFMLDFKKNEINIKLIDDEINVYFACSRSRNQMFLTIDKSMLDIDSRMLPAGFKK